MTLEAITPRQDYFGDGVTTVFPILFPFQSAGDLSVYISGVLQLYGYSISGIAGGAGGTLKFFQPPGAAQQITVLRSSTPAQSTSYSNGEVIADTLELSLDRIVMMVQWLYYQMERSLRFNELSAGVVSLPYLYGESHDNTLLGFDQYGNPEFIPQTALIPLELATVSEAESGTNNTKALTPFTGRAGVYAMLASEEQARLGVDYATLMSPLRVAQAIATLAPAAGGGLSISTTGQAQTGTDDTTAMSPLKVVQSITARLATQVQAEALSDTSALMTPLRTLQAIDARLPAWYATQTQAQSGTDNAALMTPLRVAQAIAALAPISGGSSLTISSTEQAQAGTDDTMAMSPLKVVQSISYRIATQAQAEALSDNTVLMTPARVANALQYWKSTQAQAEAGTDYATFMTPLRTAQAIAALAPTGLSLASQAQAEAGTDNTTAMTPLRVVQGITARQASLAQAQAGTDAYTLMTPLRTAQAIAALAPSGGGSLAISTTVQAQTGTDDTTAMSPLKVAQSISYRIATQPQAEALSSNTVLMTPGRVANALQYWKATQAQAQAGTDSSTLMTPLRTAQAIAALAPSSSLAISTTVQAQAGTDDTTAMSPLKVAQYVNYWKSSQADAEAGTSTITLMTPLRVAQAIAALAPSGGGSLAISTTVQAQTGTDDTTAMSPLKVVQSISYRIATQAQAEALSDNTVLMTPARVANALQYWKATQAQAEAGVDASVFMTPLRTAQAIAALAPSGGSSGGINAITAYSPTSGSNTGPFVFVPNGVFSIGVTTASLTSPYWGPGQITTSDSVSHGRFMFNQTTAVSSPGSYDSVNTAFNGGLGKSLFQIEHRLSGSTTLTKPTSGYAYVPTTSAMYIYSHNTSGWNQYTADQGGRTGGASIFIKADQYGQGDFAAITALCFVSGTKAGSTNFLANPAGVLYNGSMSAGTDGVYFNPRELYLDDSGHDVACIGDVVNLRRTNASGAKSALWMGYRVQSVGTQAVDSVMSATGSFMYGLDFALSGLTLTSNVAISLKAGQKINFSGTDSASGSLQSGWRTTATNGYSIYYDNTLPALVLLAGYTAAVQVGPTYTFVTNTLKHTGGQLGFFNVGPTGQLTGWGTPSGNSVVANFPGGSASLAQCGQAIAQFITYFKQLGLFGA